MWQFWLIASGVFFVAEMITVGFLIFWLGIGALLAMITSFFTNNLIIQTSVFVISSGLLIFFTKPLIDKYINTQKTVATNAFSIIGKTGIVIEDIDLSKGTGQINIEGDIWSAKCDDFDIIKKGTDIEVLSIDGVKALVTPLNSNEIISSKI